jgi:hypothetical protein
MPRDQWDNAMRKSIGKRMLRDMAAGGSLPEDAYCTGAASFPRRGRHDQQCHPDAGPPNRQRGTRPRTPGALFQPGTVLDLRQDPLESFEPALQAHELGRWEHVSEATRAANHAAITAINTDARGSKTVRSIQRLGQSQLEITTDLLYRVTRIRDHKQLAGDT